MNPALLWLLFLAYGSNHENRKHKRIPKLNVMHYLRAWQSLKYMETEILMRVSGLKHEQDFDILNSIRARQNNG